MSSEAVPGQWVEQIRPHAEIERIRLILETALDGVVIMNGQGMITGWNAEAERIFGWSREEAIGRMLTDTVIPPGFQDTNRQIWDEFLAVDSNPLANRRIEITALHRTGNLFPAEVALSSAKLDGEWTFSAFIRDISAQKQYSAALEERARLEALSAEIGRNLTQAGSMQQGLQACADAFVDFADAALARIWTLDEESKLLELQASAGLHNALTGAFSRIPLGLYTVGTIALEGKPYVNNDYLNDPAIADLEWAKSEGITAYAGYPLIIEGRVAGVAVLFRPTSFPESLLKALNGVTVQLAQFITRRRAEAQLIKAKEAAERADSAKTEFLAKVSHEIRTPLNGILGMTELVMGTHLDVEQLEYVSLLQSSAESLLRIVNDILDFSKMEAQKLELESIEFHLVSRIETTVRSLRVLARSKRVEVILAIAPDVPRVVVGDPGRLQQIVVNLLSNAVKFTNEGEIRVSVESCPEPGPGVTLHVSVQDTGVGISPEKQSIIFQAFTQADSSTTRKFGGTGLGLAIASHLVEIMGGKIWLESAEGKGSTFHFTVKLGV